MKFNDFLKNFNEPIFRLQDLKIAGFCISSVQLSRWAKNQLITKLANGIFAINERRSFVQKEILSNQLIQPSYISLETALAFYGLIPEVVFNCTAVNTKKTKTIDTKTYGTFIYRKIKSNLFFGYEIKKINTRNYLMADPEKALLDYLYLNSARISNADDIEELRLNEEGIRELDQEKIQKYLKIFDSKKLSKITNQILKMA